MPVFAEGKANPASHLREEVEGGASSRNAPERVERPFQDLEIRLWTPALATEIPAEADVGGERLDRLAFAVGWRPWLVHEDERVNLDERFQAPREKPSPLNHGRAHLGEPLPLAMEALPRDDERA